MRVLFHRTNCSDHWDKFYYFYAKNHPFLQKNWGLDSISLGITLVVQTPSKISPQSQNRSQSYDHELNASAGKIYNATSSPVLLENKNVFFFFEKTL
jgi:hypothetical protein